VGREESANGCRPECVRSYSTVACYRSGVRGFGLKFFWPGRLFYLNGLSFVAVSGLTLRMVCFQRGDEVCTLDKERRRRVADLIDGSVT